MVIFTKPRNKITLDVHHLMNEQWKCGTNEQVSTKEKLTSEIFRKIDGSGKYIE